MGYSIPMILTFMAMGLVVSNTIRNATMDIQANSTVSNSTYNSSQELGDFQWQNDSWSWADYESSSEDEEPTFSIAEVFGNDETCSDGEVFDKIREQCVQLLQIN